MANLAPGPYFSFCIKLGRNMCDIDQGLYPAICFQGEYETVRGDDQWPKATSRGAKRRAGEVTGEGVSPPHGWWSGGVTPGKIWKFETQFGAIWCILARNWRFASFPPLWMKTLS